MKKKEEIPKKEKVEKVTKTKSPGRVESGKRLVEYNRLKKLEAKNREQKEKIITQEEEVKEEEYNQIKIIEKPTEVNIYKTSNVALFLLAGMIGGGIYIYIKNGKQIKKKQKK